VTGGGRSVRAVTHGGGGVTATSGGGGAASMIELGFDGWED
jgi:hypothetical protein